MGFVTGSGLRELSNCSGCSERSLLKLCHHVGACHPASPATETKQPWRPVAQLEFSPCDHVLRSRAQDAKEAKQEHGQEVTAGSGGSYNTKGSGLVNGTKSSGAPRSTHSRAYEFQCHLSRSPQVVGGIRPPRFEPPCPCRSSASATTARPTASRTRATRKGSGSGAIAGCRSPDPHSSRAPTRGVFLGVISQ